MRNVLYLGLILLLFSCSSRKQKVPSNEKYVHTSEKFSIYLEKDSDRVKFFMKDFTFSDSTSNDFILFAGEFLFLDTLNVINTRYQLNGKSVFLAHYYDDVLVDDKYCESYNFPEIIQFLGELRNKKVSFYRKVSFSNVYKFDLKYTDVTPKWAVDIDLN